jgi:hypothetical protein
LRQALLATGDDRTRNHYSSLDESLAAVARQKFNNVFTEVCFPVSYIGAADVYTAFEAELQDQTSTQYAEYFKVIQGGGAKRVNANSASHRQYILAQAVRGMFGEDSEGSLHKKHYGGMEKYLKTALTLHYLSDVFGPGVHALLISSSWEKMWVFCASAIAQMTMCGNTLPMLESGEPSLQSFSTSKCLKEELS